MRNASLILTLAAGVMVAVPAAAQTGHFQWSGTVGHDKAIEIRGGHASLRATKSEDHAVHVDAHISDATTVPIQVVEHYDGVTICVGGCNLNGAATNLQQYEVRIDFVIRVPEDVRFVGNTTDGDITIEGLHSEVTVTTVAGRVRIQAIESAAQATTVTGSVVLELPAGQRAQFHANTVSGSVESDFPMFDDAPALPNWPAAANRKSPRIVRAAIGKGGPDLRVTTVSGSIRLQRR